ncbi:hypothetical protein LOAG_09915 [Loa loa]|uniref:Uncharacterized protein n=1 Tax=Loa loa TaxID=7209 RepID=A0A1S0TSG6_LOALO|nr:hypothetical protein LOAG_09915 [Loa loa]EFO18579.1 hypothetical protein LOAG_09915 [Loa loa]
MCSNLAIKNSSLLFCTSLLRLNSVWSRTFRETLQSFAKGICETKRSKLTVLKFVNRTEYQSQIVQAFGTAVIFGKLTLQKNERVVIRLKMTKNGYRHIGRAL